jgi:hypothetical protein
MGDFEYLAAFARSTKAPSEGSYWDSPEAARMSEAVGPAVFKHPNTRLYDLLYDGCEPWQSSRYSTSLGAIRDAANNEEDRSKQFNCKTLFLTIGPRAPANMDSVLRRTVLSLAHYLKKGIQVTAVTAPNLPFKLTPLLSSGIMDSIARIDLSAENGVGSYMFGGGCCDFSGTLVKNTVYPLGYDKPAPQYM